MEKYIGYCVKCRDKRDMLETGITTAKNGRRMVKGVCKICKTRMCKFIKNQDVKGDNK